MSSFLWLFPHSETKLIFPNIVWHTTIFIKDLFTYPWLRMNTGDGCAIQWCTTARPDGLFSLVFLKALPSLTFCCFTPLSLFKTKSPSASASSLASSSRLSYSITFSWEAPKPALASHSLLLFYMGFVNMTVLVMWEDESQLRNYLCL
jgi:hypothetical protein